MIDVVIAAGDPILRVGLRRIVHDTGDCRVAGEVDNTAAVRFAVERFRPDVLLMDVAFRRRDPTLLPELGAGFPDTRVLVLVDHTADQCALRLIDQGGGGGLSPEAVEMLDECCLVSLRDSALGCVAKGMDADHVIQAIRTVAGGEVAAAPWLSRFVSGTRSASFARGHPPLTRRELEVLALVADGLSNKRVAGQLSVKEQTVKNHLGRIMKKLGLRSRLEVGVFAIRNEVRVPAGPASVLDGPPD